MSRTRRPIRLAAAAALLAAATLGLPSTPAQAQATHVGVIVDFGSQGGVQSHCSPGGSGYSVLDDGFTVSENRTGLVTKINGVGTDNPPLDLYWSYWHLGSHGVWSYAGDNPNTNSITPGSVDGWRYGDGKSAPPVISYTSICAGRDPVPVPTHTPAPTPVRSSTHRTSPPPVNAPPGAGRTSRAGSTRDRSTEPNATVSPKSRAPSAARSADSWSTVPSQSSASASGAASSSTSALPIAPPKAAPAKRSGLPTWGTALALVAVAALGGVAVWRARVQRHNQL